MSDIADVAQKAIEALSAAAPRQPEGPAATGTCLWCGEPLPQGQRWCNAECRDDWAHDAYMRARRAEK